EGGLRGYLTPLGQKNVLIPVLYLGLLASIVAFFMMNFTLSRIKAFQSAVFANLTTVISIVAGVMFRNEPFYWFQVVGAIMIIVGVWGTNYYGKLKQPVKKLQV
ncbi:MAG: EamA family transporter, partial [Halanaerobiales bacterium]